MMQKTEDLTIFKEHPSNRKIDPINLKNIIKSLQSKNMLELRPITVNKKMQVIDGQHRLEAAKALGIPMFYVVDKESELEDIVRLNNSQKSWILEDYVNYHASDGVKFFVDIVNLAKKLDITINHLVRYLGISGGSSWKKMKDGSYEFDLEKTGKELQEKLAFIDGILKFIEEKTIGNKKYLKSMAITKGLLTLMNSSMFNADIFFKKVELCITRIHICRTVEEYYQMFKGVYNFRNNDPIE